MVYSDTKENISVDLKFALPGKERQDSVYSGLQVPEQSFHLVLHLLFNEILTFHYFTLCSIMISYLITFFSHVKSLINLGHEGQMWQSMK